MCIDWTGSSSPILRPNEAIEFKTLRALLRLSFKYEIPHVRQELLRRLGARFSYDLEEWDTESGTGRLIKMRPRDAVAVVNIARSYDLDILLPAAFFECCQLPKGQLVAKVSYGGDDVEQLSQDDLRLCLVASDQLAKRSHWIRRLLFDESVWEDANCTSPPECRIARNEVVRALATNTDNESFHSTNPLSILAQHVVELVEEEDLSLCKDCQETFEEWQEIERRIVWKDLGRMFGVSNWLGSLD